MIATINSQKITLSNVDAKKVRIKCQCPRCESISFIGLMDFSFYGGELDCGFCEEDGWDDCLMVVTEIEITYI